MRPPTPESEPTSPTQRSFTSAASPPPRPPRPSQSPSSVQRQNDKKPKSKDKEDSRSRATFKPIDFQKERHVVLQTIAAAKQSATNLTNALKRLNRETQTPEDDPQIQQLYRQCRKLRKEILIYIQRTESEEWIGTLINANDELIQSLARYEQALKPVEQDSDSDAWNVSDSDEEKAPRTTSTSQKRMSTGGSGRSSIAEDLARKLRATTLSQETPPPKPPRPVQVDEMPPPRPPRPSQQPLLVSNYRCFSR